MVCEVCGGRGFDGIFKHELCYDHFNKYWQLQQNVEYLADPDELVAEMKRRWVKEK